MFTQYLRLHGRMPFLELCVGAWMICSSPATAGLTACPTIRRPRHNLCWFEPQVQPGSVDGLGNAAGEAQPALVDAGAPAAAVVSIGFAACKPYLKARRSTHAASVLSKASALPLECHASRAMNIILKVIAWAMARRDGTGEAQIQCH